MVYWKRPSSPFISGILMLLSSSSTNFRVSAFTADTNTNNPLFLFLDTVRQAHSELLVLLPQHRRSSSCSFPTYWAVVLCTTNSTTLLSLKCTSSSCTHTSPGLCRWCGFYSQQVQRQQRWRIPETGGRRRRQARKSFWTHMYTHLEKGQRNMSTRINCPPRPPGFLFLLSICPQTVYSRGVKHADRGPKLALLGRFIWPVWFNF